uniref:Uncharacterized protein n=1 Tax=Arundo donax TaxID=35708 RepID=A0A0A9F5S5_ARUDO
MAKTWVFPALYQNLRRGK